MELGDSNSYNNSADKSVAIVKETSRATETVVFCTEYATA